MDDIWTVERILSWIEKYLFQHGDAQARLSAQWLVSEALGISRTRLFLDRSRPLSNEERDTLRDWVKQRSLGRPLQYITGSVGFRHIVLHVRPSVLIPRPETEVLVSEALKTLPSSPKPQDIYQELFQDDRQLACEDATACEKEAHEYHENREEQEGHETIRQSEAPEVSQAPSKESEELLVADICTGCGCIACSIASEHPYTRVIATDISPEAVELARENVSLLGLNERVAVLNCDLGSDINKAEMQKFDLVVSNPPYIPTAALADIPSEVRNYEPRLALDGGVDGLEVFKRLLAWSHDALKPAAVLAVELDERTIETAAALAETNGFSACKIVKDLAGKPRILLARRNAD